MPSSFRHSTFDHRVGLKPGDVRELLLDRPDVRASLERDPYPPPPMGPPFLLMHAGRQEIRIRHYAGAQDSSSPILVMRLTPAPGGTRVQGHFERELAELRFRYDSEHSRRFGRWLMGGTGAAVFLMELWPPAAVALALAIPVWLFVAGFCSGAFVVSRGEFRRRLFDFASEVFAPHLVVELEGGLYRTPPALAPRP